MFMVALKWHGLHEDLYIDVFSATMITLLPRKSTLRSSLKLIATQNSRPQIISLVQNHRLCTRLPCLSTRMEKKKKKNQSHVW